MALYHSPDYQPSFESIGLLFQEKKFNTDFQDWRPFWISNQKRKTDFQDDGYGGHLEFPNGTILANFDLQVTLVLSTSFKSTGLLVQEKKRKIDFQDGGNSGHLGFPIRTILATF